jgi:hypothetical protein
VNPNSTARTRSSPSNTASPSPGPGFASRKTRPGRSPCRLPNARLLAPLRDQRGFFSVAAANEALWDRCGNSTYNLPFRSGRGAASSSSSSWDQPALRPSPAQPFEIATWKRTTVGLDYHVEPGTHLAAVPHAKTSVDLRLTPHLVEVFLNSVRIAASPGAGPSQHPCPADHPERTHAAPHQRVGEWTPQRLRTRAEELGPDSAAGRAADAV